MVVSKLPLVLDLIQYSLGTFSYFYGETEARSVAMLGGTFTVGRRTHSIPDLPCLTLPLKPLITGSFLTHSLIFFIILIH